MAAKPYRLTRPVDPDTGVIFAAPHSGRAYPETFVRGSALDPRALRSSEDAFVDRLFAEAPEHGIPLLAAETPRAYVDLNRAIDELDPAVVAGARGGGANPRIEAGLGVVPRVVSEGRAIYRGKISMTEANRRLRDHWRPYHDALARQIDESVRMFGRAILVDLHSMPRAALEMSIRPGEPRPDVVLGDRFGTTAAPEIVDRVEEAFALAGFRVTRNRPFAGGYTTARYGCPARRVHAVQMEIDRGIYMDEAGIRPHDGFDGVRARLSGVMGRLAEIGRPVPPPAAG